MFLQPQQTLLNSKLHKIFFALLPLKLFNWIILTLGIMFHDLFQLRLGSEFDLCLFSKLRQIVFSSCRVFSAKQILVEIDDVIKRKKKFFSLGMKFYICIGVWSFLFGPLKMRRNFVFGCILVFFHAKSCTTINLISALSVEKKWYNFFGDSS